MDRQPPHNNSSNNLVSKDSMITVQTVYDLAADIGEEFKKLIELHGPELNQSLIPSVVRVLEYLEDSVLQREEYLLLVDKLHRQVDELQRGHNERAQQQLKYFTEIEEIDETWRKENIQLSQYVAQLRSENKRLASSLNEKFSQSLTDLKQDSDEDDRAKQSKLEQLKKRASLLCKELQLKNDEIDNLKTQNDTLSDENQNLRNLVSTQTRHNNSSQANADKSATECIAKLVQSDETCRRDLEAKIRSLEEEIEMYKMRLKMAETSIEAVEATAESVPITNDRNNNSEQEDDEENVKMEDLPVQGPIPKEPDEKDFLRDRKSRIWSFFPRLINRIK